eukprot:1245758-Karenia_brevis.AAC.1
MPHSLSHHPPLDHLQHPMMNPPQHLKHQRKIKRKRRKSRMEGGAVKEEGQAHPVTTGEIKVKEPLSPTP